jgi:hypothetical protein
MDLFLLAPVMRSPTRWRRCPFTAVMIAKLCRVLIASRQGREVSPHNLLAGIIAGRRADDAGVGRCTTCFPPGMSIGVYTMVSHAARTIMATMGMMMGAQNDPVMTGASFPRGRTP